MSIIEEEYGTDMARLYSKVNAVHKEREVVEKFKQEQETLKSDNYEHIKMKYKDDLSAVFSKIAAELHTLGFENDKRITEKIVNDHIDRWCKIFEKEDE